MIKLWNFVSVLLSSFAFNALCMCLSLSLMQNLWPICIFEFRSTQASACLPKSDSSLLLCHTCCMDICLPVILMCPSSQSRTVFIPHIIFLWRSFIVTICQRDIILSTKGKVSFENVMSRKKKKKKKSQSGNRLNLAAWRAETCAVSSETDFKLLN